jgi:Domain of unknown function (DUF4136)
MASSTHRWVRAGALAGIAWMAATACAPAFRVHTDYDSEARFANLRTYAWIDSAPIVRDSGANPFLERRVRRAVEHGLHERGLALGTDGAPDILVTAFVLGPTSTRTRRPRWSTAPCGPVVSLRIGIGYPYGFGVRHPWWPWRSPYYRYPWGYACSYRIGFGYMWLPIYEAPATRLAGTLVIDVLDPETQTLIWRGSAEGAVAVDDRESASQEELDEVAIRILREFPPR